MRTAATSEAALAPPPAIAMLAGCTLSRIAVDDSLTLGLRASGRSATLRIDGAGRLQAAGGARAFDTDGDPASAGPLLGLLNSRVDEATVRADGALELRFAGGERLVVEPSDHAIAWTAIASDGAQASCLAEGKVVWE